MKVILVVFVKVNVGGERQAKRLFLAFSSVMKGLYGGGQQHQGPHPGAHYFQ